MRILFICHGNICRSTMAQSVFAHLARRAGADGDIEVDSAATSTEEIGNPPHPGTRRVLAEHGIPLIDHRARQVRPGELGHWDLVVCMDDANVRGIERILGRADAGGTHPRVEKLLAFAPASLRPAPLRADGSARDVADPWYTGDYDTTYRDVLAGCEGLAASLFQSIP